MSFEFGGNGNYENHVVGFWGDFVAYVMTGSNTGTDRFGDYVTISERRRPSRILETCLRLSASPSILLHPRRLVSRAISITFCSAGPPRHVKSSDRREKVREAARSLVALEHACVVVYR